MATIKEVAAAAGVSVGTVSNVLNGKTKNRDLIERVEKTVRELGFRPDAKARSLKSTQTYLIGILVSTLGDRNVQLMNTAIEKELRTCGYSIVIKTTDNNEILEQKHIEYFLQLGVDGIIVNTAVKEKRWMGRVKEANIPVVFTNKEIALENNMDVVQVNYRTAFRECFEWFQKADIKKAGMILENGLVSRELLEELKKETDIDISYKVVGDNSNESGFKAAFEILYEQEEIDAVIIGSYQLAQGAGKAVEVFEQKNKPVCRVCIKAENWIEDDDAFEAIIEVSNYEMGCIAASRMIEKINVKDKNRTNIVSLQAQFKVRSKVFYNGNKCTVSTSNTLHVGILNAETASVLKKLSKVYEKENGIHLEYHTMSYHKLWEAVSDKNRLENSGMDIVLYDVIWKETLAELGVLEDITKLKINYPGYFEDYIDHIVEHYGEYNGSLYGLPFLTGTQLLFYQKDLFEDQILKLQFERKYGYELNPPSGWGEYNEVAEFFTKSYNENSPVRYGTALINQGNLYNSIEFLNRLWSMGGNLIENNKLVADSAIMKIALEQYKSSFQYTNQEEQADSWEDISRLFKSGSAAMAILYDSYAFGINDSMNSKVAGNIGSGMIPGGTPVLGGWGMAISSCSRMKELAANFMMWACGRRIAHPYAVLSGISSRKSFYLNKDLDGLYPWKSNVLESYSQSRLRGLLRGYGSMDINIRLYDDVIGKELGRYVRGESQLEEAVDTMEQKARHLLRL